MPSMSGHLSDDDFHRASEQWYEYSVRQAAEEAYREAAWRSEHEAYAVLATALQRHGIDPDPDAVRAGAALISRGRRPSVMRTPTRTTTGP